MATTRVTVSLPSELAAKLKSEAGDQSVSAFVADLLEEHLEEADLERLWQAYLVDAGVTAEDIMSAKEMLDGLLNQASTDAA